LKIAAGQFKFVQEQLIVKLIKSNSNSNKMKDFYDTTDAILNTYINQSKAEAQESEFTKLKNSCFSKY
jgi:hypothetical protein